MKISNEVANVLAESRVDGKLLYLPDYQLERNLYMSVDKVLKAIAGKWNRKEKAHIFESNVEDIIEEILQTGEYTDAKKEYQFFETPNIVVRRMKELISVVDYANAKFLEPNAGKGAIAKHISEIDCIELNPENREVLRKLDLRIVFDDFLEFIPNKKYDIIIANPPFSKQQDIDHVNRMLDIAKKQVISIMSGSVLWRENRKTTEFRLRVESLGGTIEALPEESFAESGTKVQTCLMNVIF